MMRNEPNEDYLPWKRKRLLEFPRLGAQRKENEENYCNYSLLVGKDREEARGVHKYRSIIFQTIKYLLQQYNPENSK